MSEFFARVSKKNEGLCINVPLHALEPFSRGDLVHVRKINADALKIPKNASQPLLCGTCGMFMKWNFKKKEAFCPKCDVIDENV